LAFDLAYQSNTQSRFSGLQYSSQGLSRILDQKSEVNSTFQYLKTLATNVVLNSTLWDNSANTPFQGANTQVILGASPGTGYTANLVANIFDVFLDIYNNGIYEVTDKIVPNKYPANADTALRNTANLLIANKNFMQSEAATFFANNYSYATYMPNRTVFLDVGKLIDAVTFDISNDGNRQTITQAVLYYDYLQDVSAINNQIVQTSGAFAYIKTIIDDILTLSPIANTYQTTYLQNTSFAANVTPSEILYVRNRVDDITNIINNGPTYENVQYNIERFFQYFNIQSHV
jgi:hypothetical protein